MKHKVLIAFLLIVIFAFACAPKNAVKSPTVSDDIIGIWSGKLDVGGKALTIVFNIAKEGETVIATMDSPDQGVTGIDVESVSCSGGNAVIMIKKIGGSFEGKLEGGSMTGTWKQGGAEFPLTLEKKTEAPKMNRPQEPKEPYPYKSEDVKFKNEKAGIYLAGTLTMPEGDGPFPAVIMVSGSGKQDRNETVFGHKPFLIIADWLTRNGVAVLRYDDRGAGESEGVFKDGTTMDFADDAEAAFNYLYSLPTTDKKFAGIIGHSEGGMIAPIVASRDKDVKFIILLAGPGITLEEVILQQSKDMQTVSGADSALIANAYIINKKIYDAAKSDLSDSALAEQVKKIMTDYRETLDDTLKSEIDDETIEGSAKMVTGKWFRAGMKLDHTPYVAKVKCPVLAINGEKDLQVSAAVNLPALEKLLKDGGNKDYTISLLPGINHALQKCETGLPSEYASIETTVDSTVLYTISDWMKAKYKQYSK